MEEIFKEADEFNDYEVSNCGRIRTKSREIPYTHSVTGNRHFRTSSERYLKTYLSASGYRFVQLYKDKQANNNTIHRLVATNFISNPDNLKDVNHIDGNKLNNRVDNLEWCTSAYNHEHATMNELKPRGSEIGTSLLNEKCVVAIKGLLAMNWSHSKIALLFHVSRSTITLISTGVTWKHVTPSPEHI